MLRSIGSEIIVDIHDITNSREGLTSALGPDPGLEPNKSGTPIAGLVTLVTAYFDYELPAFSWLPGRLIPWTILFYDNLPGATKGAERINDFKIDLGLNLEGAIPNTVFGIAWNSGSLIQEAKHKWGYLHIMAEIKL